MYETEVIPIKFEKGEGEGAEYEGWKRKEEVRSGIQRAAELLRGDDVIAIPTETVYGLAGNALSSQAVLKIFKAKNRPADNPLICHVSSVQMLEMIVDHQFLLTQVFNQESKSFAKLLIDQFWPGPLTLLLPKNDKVPDVVTAGQKTVAVRFPGHPVARALIEEAGFPLAAPSANSSGNTSPTIASHVLQDLNGKIKLVIDGGASKSGIESTVVDVMRNPPVILRPGGITLEQIRQIIPNVLVYSKDFSDKELEERPSTPGMKYRHYSPKAKVLLFEGPINKIRDAISKELEKLHHEGISYGLVKTHSPDSFRYNVTPFSNSNSNPNSNPNPNPNSNSNSNLDVNVNTIPNQQSGKRNFEIQLGTEENLEEVAHGLFKTLRDLDDHQVDLILIEGVGEEREGLAVMNRLRKAASHLVVLKD